MSASSQPAIVALEDGGTVSALLDAASAAHACLVLAHGAGAGMRHAFMATLAAGLAARGIAVLRFQFPYMERGSRRPDPPAVAHSAIRSAVAEARRRFPDLPIFAGGKSYGGRMTTQAQADTPLATVSGLVLVGFPLHPARRLGTSRADHLTAISAPMLFVQGTRDALADLELMKTILRPLHGNATLKVIDDADHAFSLPARSGRDDAAALAEIVQAISDWIERRY